MAPIFLVFTQPFRCHFEKKTTERGVQLPQRKSLVKSKLLQQHAKTFSETGMTVGHGSTTVAVVKNREKKFAVKEKRKGLNANAVVAGRSHGCILHTTKSVQNAMKKRILPNWVWSYFCFFIIQSNKKKRLLQLKTIFFIWLERVFWFKSLWKDLKIKRF